jgi:hypothetical protein
MQENLERRKTDRSIHNSHHFLQNKQAPRSLRTAFKRRLSQEQENNGNNMIHCVALSHKLNIFLFTTL